MSKQSFISRQDGENRYAWYKDKQEFLRAHKEWHDRTYPPSPYFPDARTVPEALFDGLVQAVKTERENASRPDIPSQEDC